MVTYFPQRGDDAALFAKRPFLLPQFPNLFRTCSIPKRIIVAFIVKNNNLGRPVIRHRQDGGNFAEGDLRRLLSDEFLRCLQPFSAKRGFYLSACSAAFKKWAAGHMEMLISPPGLGEGDKMINRLKHSFELAALSPLLFSVQPLYPLSEFGIGQPLKLFFCSPVSTFTIPSLFFAVFIKVGSVSD